MKAAAGLPVLLLKKTWRSKSFRLSSATKRHEQKEKDQQYMVTRIQY